MDDCVGLLGFEPQRETPYNKLLPYSQALEEESVKQLAVIKAYLGRTVQLRDLKIGGSHWTGQLTKYIRMNGLKFSKEDHLIFINIIFELTTVPDLQYSLVQKYAQLLITLLKKKKLISRDDLVLPWRPLYKLVEGVSYSRYEDHGLVLLPHNIEDVLKHLVRVCRVYFSVESTQEMLDEWRPLMCPFDITMNKAMYYFGLFLPTNLPPEHHPSSINLWFEELIGLWESCQNSPSWEPDLVTLFARLSTDCIGYINWEPYIPKIFTRILRSFNLPVGTNAVRVMRNGNTYEVNQCLWWIVGMMGGGSSTQEHLEKMFSALESFFHPSNYGKWINKLMKLMHRLPSGVVRRIHRERHEKTWEMSVPASHRLTDQEVTRFVTSMVPIVSLAMFSKTGSHNPALAFRHLAVLRPEIVIPPLLEKLYPALETLIEPHRLIACLYCTVAVGRSMLSSTRWFPEGRSHVLPLLNLCLPGIDPNDLKKSLITFQLVSTLTSLVRIVDCSQAINLRDDLTELEVELCSATAQFEDFVLQFLDRIFVLIENSSQEHTRTDSSTEEQLTGEESMLEVGLLSTVSAILQQSSPQILKEALDRIFRFVSTNIMEIKVAGRFTADLVRCAAKVNAELTLKIFLRHFASNILQRTSSEKLAQEEHLDNEFLWNMKHLSELVQCDGQCLLPYRQDLVSVLHATLHLRCKDAAGLAGNMLRNILRDLTHIYNLDSRSTASNWNAPLTEVLPIREWGQSADIDSLDLQWHIPSEDEKDFATELLSTFLLPELDRIHRHIQEEHTMTRDELKLSLALLMHCMRGAGAALPLWTEPPVKLIDCEVEMKRFDHTASLDPQGITLNGQNVLKLITDSIRPLLVYMLKSAEDDTKSLVQLIKVYNCVLFFHGAEKDDFDDRWKSLHIVKKSMENKLCGKKRRIRALLVDRAQLQHELRVMNQRAKVFTSTHLQIFQDLLTLSLSRYSQVRKSAQRSLDRGCHQFAYSYRCLLSDVLHHLQDSPEVQHHQLKGALHVILGREKRCLVSKRSWLVMLQTWPALVKTQHSEKPSILQLIDSIMEKLTKNIETAEISIKCTDSLMAASNRLWTEGTVPHPSIATSSEEELQRGVTEEEKRNTRWLKMYHELVETLVTLIEGGTLMWKFHQVALDMLSLLVRYDIPLPPSAVAVFTKGMVHSILQVRKVCVSSVSGILKQQKRPHKKREIDPYALGEAGTRPPTLEKSGVRQDNKWMLYSGKERVFESKQVWDSTVFLDKTHWGYYTWPKHMMVHDAMTEQPCIDRTPDNMTEAEQVIADHFNNQDFIDKLLAFLSLEENKGQDKFHSKYFTLFKGLFRNYGDMFVPILRPHMERLVADVTPQTHEFSQRLAAEMTAGIVRGSKHWGYDKTCALWLWLTPVISTGLTNLSVECVGDWGTSFATASESRDPRRLSPMFDILMNSPLNGEGGSFGDSSRMYILQGALAQQEWRIPQLLHDLLSYLSSHLLYSYKNVRDRLGSVLVSVFHCDIRLPHSAPSVAPSQSDFIHNTVLPQLQTLLDNTTNDQKDNGTNHEKTASDSTILASAMNDCVMEETERAEDEGEEEAGGDGQNNERKTAVKFCKTVMKWLQGSLSRMLQCPLQDLFHFLPILCSLVSETQDVELRREAEVTLACLAQTQLTPDHVTPLLTALKQVSEMSSWHARGACLGYTQVMVFYNFFLLLEPETLAQIRSLILTLLCDDQLEVREMAAITLGGLLHCGYLSIDDHTLKHFRKLSSTRVGKRRRGDESSQADLDLRPERLIKRHAGVLGLGACVQAFPYDVPDFVPEVLMLLSSHLDDPQPIQLTVKKSLSNFKRTHLDNWHDHKQKFTDDQLVVLTDLLVSPNYYA